MPRLETSSERWPLAGTFVIARGARTESLVVVAEITDGTARGRGECSPLARYSESVESVLAQIDGVRSAIEAGAGREALQPLLPPGAARNALDCALWDLEAKASGEPVWKLAGLKRPEPIKTAYTLSLGDPEAMAEAARAAARRPLLKLKLDGGDDLARVEAVRAAAPLTRLIVDANEALDFDGLKRLAPELKRLGVLLIEQPLPAGEDEALEGFDSPVTLCADESIHSRAELAVCARRYGAVNIKLDKTGGLTEALALKAEAQALGLEIMVGCMLGTSLAMAPGMLAAQGAAFVDLDAPLLMARDREPGIAYVGSAMTPPPPELWG